MNTINYVLNYIKYTVAVIQDECAYVETILLEINQHHSVLVFVWLWDGVKLLHSWIRIR